MTTMKKLFLVFLSALLLVSIFTSCGEKGTEGLEYSKYNSNTKDYSVSRYKGSESNVVISSTYKGKPVSYIGPYAFMEETHVTSIMIPDSVTSIGAGAFAKCSLLSNIVIPNSVTEIDYNVFQDCEALTNITIPNSIQVIPGNTFLNCTSLQSVTLPKSITKIVGTAFTNCTSLTRINYEGTVDEWNNINIGRDYFDPDNPHYCTVYCSDGEVEFVY